MADRRVSTGLVLLGLAVLVYAIGLTYPNTVRALLYRDSGIGLTFNSMFEHLLRWEFDVDPEIIGVEAFERNGKTYAYWGIVPALLRAPLLLLPGGLKLLNVTTLFCLAAVSLAAGAKLLTLQRVFRDLPRTATTQLVYWTLAATLLFSGAQIAYLKPSVYIEVCLWTAAFGAVLVCCAVHGLLARRFTTGLLAAMAAAAGLGLNTRVSLGVGLYAAMGLLLLVLLLSRVDGEGMPPLRANIAGRVRLLATPRFLVPIAILLAFVGVAALVNYERWGNPLMFMDPRYYTMNAEFPDRLPREATYGLFSFSRIPFGLVYYFFPVWALSRGDGHYFLEEHQLRLFDVAELPVGSFLLTDVLLVAFACYTVWRLVARRVLPLPRAQVAAIAAGLGSACVLMLSAVSMAYRYRLDFYPCMEFATFAGLYVFLQGRTRLTAPQKGLLLAGASVSILGSVFLLLVLKISPWGPGLPHLREHVYAPLLEKLLQ